jgi:hypothetical protein
VHRSLIGIAALRAHAEGVGRDIAEPEAQLGDGQPVEQSRARSSNLVILRLETDRPVIGRRRDAKISRFLLLTREREELSRVTLAAGSGPQPGKLTRHRQSPR